jgi:hypothetical protein
MAENFRRTSSAGVRSAQEGPLLSARSASQSTRTAISRTPAPDTSLLSEEIGCSMTPHSSDIYTANGWKNEQNRQRLKAV